jgi:hypothetical protein
MSDFESDSSYEYDIYESGYSDNETTTNSNIIIDMDDDSLETTITKPITKPITKITTKPITKPITKPNENVDVNEEKELVNENTEDSKFEFNMSLCDLFVKDLDPKQVFIRNSKYTDDDTKLTYLLIKILNIKEYKCFTKKCKVGNEWNSKPIQLLINRINGVNNDLSITNLELLCPNCYMVKYGIELFMKKIKEATYNCRFCGYNLANMSNYKKKERICLACEKKISKIGFENIQSNYFKNLEEKTNDLNLSTNLTFGKTTISGTGTRKKYISKNTNSNNNSNNNNNSKDIIKITLNTTLPNIDDI